MVSGEPLFASVDKFDSGTGWPSFTMPLGTTTKRDFSMLFPQGGPLGQADSHLRACVFKDGPATAAGCDIASTPRHCASSTATTRGTGYGDYVRLFDKEDTVSEKTAYERLQDRDIRRRLLLGHAGPDPAPARVISTRVGYTGGQNANATYRNHPRSCRGRRDRLTTRPKTDYRALLEFFFQIHDPTTKNRQGNDIGTSYRSAIFYPDDEQKQVALDTIADVDASGCGPARLVTEVVPASDFWEAEPSTRDYLQRIPNGYLPTSPARLAAAEARRGSSGAATPRCHSVVGDNRPCHYGEPDASTNPRSGPCAWSYLRRPERRRRGCRRNHRQGLPMTSCYVNGPGDDHRAHGDRHDGPRRHPTTTSTKVIVATSPSGQRVGSLEFSWRWPDNPPTPVKFRVFTQYLPLRVEEAGVHTSAFTTA